MCIKYILSPRILPVRWCFCVVLWIPCLRVLDMSHGLIQQTKEKHKQAFGIVKERIVTTQPCSVIEEVQHGGECVGALGFCGPKNPKVHCQYCNVLVTLKHMHWNVFIVMKCKFFFYIMCEGWHQTFSYKQPMTFQELIVMKWFLFFPLNMFSISWFT